MFENSVPNSDSEQCIESRLGWVHRVHTLNPSCAHAARWASRVVAHQATCRRPPPTASWPSSRSCRSAHRLCRRPGHASCRHALAHAAARSIVVSSVVSRASWPYRGTGPTMSQHYIATQPVAKPSSCHDTTDCIVTHLSGQVALLSRYN